MRNVLRKAGVLLLVLVALVTLAALLLPAEPLDRTLHFNEADLTADLDGWLAGREGHLAGIVPGTEKRIVWAGTPGKKTPVSVVYLHGFTASSEEIRPVPDLVAKALGANLFFTRLAGHGQGEAALDGATAGDWLNDMAEALAIGRRLGDRVLVISTSTGGTLAAFAVLDPDLSPDLSRDLEGIVFVSPNFGMRNWKARLPGWPGARWWGPVLFGARQGTGSEDPEVQRYWTTHFPTSAVIQLSALVRASQALDPARARVPALFVLSATDQVTDTEASARFAATWGAGAQVNWLRMGAGDDPWGHVLAGRIFSPGQTDHVTRLILDWAGGL